MRGTTRKFSTTLGTRSYSVFLKFNVFRLILFGPSIIGPRVFGVPRKSHFGPTMMNQFRIEAIKARRSFESPANPKNSEYSVSTVKNIEDDFSSSLPSGRRIFPKIKGCWHFRSNSIRDGKQIFPYHSNAGLMMQPKERQNTGKQSTRDSSASLSSELSSTETKIREDPETNTKNQENKKNQSTRSVPKLRSWFDYWIYDIYEDSYANDDGDYDDEDDDDDDDRYEDRLDWTDETSFKC